MKGKVYTVGVKFYYDVYKSHWFKYIFVKHRSRFCQLMPIFAKSSEEAILKYQNRYKWETRTPPWWFRDVSEELRNVSHTVEIYSDANNYTFDKLKQEMNSQDFLEYCRQELLSVQEIIN